MQSPSSSDAGPSYKVTDPIAFLVNLNFPFLGRMLDRFSRSQTAHTIIKVSSLDKAKPLFLGKELS